ncbi:MAG: NTP transferase domain-containing protein [Luteibacter sp.]
MPHDAIILAAGGSLRLGRPKQTLTIDGESLLQRTTRIVASTMPRRLITVLGANAGDLRAHADANTVIVNPAWATGMASSLACAAAAMGQGQMPIVVTVVDQPALAERHLMALLAAYDGSCEVVTAYGKSFGVPVVLRPETLARANTLRGDEGLRKLWIDDGFRSVRDDVLAFDLDTEADVYLATQRGLLDHQDESA